MTKRSNSRTGSSSRRPRGEQRVGAELARPEAARRAWRKEWLVLLGLIGGALLVRAIVLAQLAWHPLLQPQPGGVLDDSVYVKLATRVASGDLALGPDVYYVSPFYTYFLGLVFALTGGSVMAARALQIVLGAAAVGLIAATASAWFGRRAGILSGVLAACTGLLAFNEILILQSSVDPFLTALALFLLARAVRRPSVWQFAAAGAAIGALALNRPNALPVAAVVALTWLIVQRQRSRSAVRQVAALCVGVALLVLPVTIRNRVVAGEWVLITSHGGLNFYIGNSAAADGTYKGVPGIRPSIEGQKEDVRNVASEALRHPASASEASSYFYGRAWEWISAHPIAWALLLGRKLALGLNAADVALNYSYVYFARDESTLLSWLVIGPWLIVPLGLFGLAAGRREEPETRGAYLTWVVFVPVYLATLVAFFVSSRYRLALLVPLLVGAGASLTWIQTRVAAGARGRLLAGGAVLAALFLAANWPMTVEDGRMYEREERIVRFITDGQFEEGERLLADTAPRHANRAVMFYRVGLAYRDRQRPADAARYFERAATLNTKEPWIHFNLGEVLLQTGAPDEAIAHLQVARAAGISPSTVAFDLASAYQALGQADRARAELDALVISAEMTGDSLLRCGALALNLHDLALAERFLREAVKRSPGLASAHEHLGVVLGMAGNVADAVPELETAMTLDAENPVTHFHLAVAYAQAGRFADARAQAMETLRRNPNDGSARALLAQLGGAPR